MRSEFGEPSKRQDLLSRALRGAKVHDSEYRSLFLSNTGNMHDVHLYITYMPIVYNGTQIGVLESYDNAAETFSNLNSRTVEIGTVVIGAFTCLYMMLYFSLVRTDRDIYKWQKRITKNEELLNESQAIAGLGSYEIDLSSGQIQCSQTLERLFGIDKTYEHTLAGWEA